MNTLEIQSIFAVAVWLGFVLLGAWAYPKKLLSLAKGEFCIAACICFVSLLENTHSSSTITGNHFVELGVFANLALICVVGLNWSRKVYAEPTCRHVPKAQTLGIALSVLRDQAPGHVWMFDSNEILWSRPANRRGVIAEGQLVEVSGVEGPCCKVRPVGTLNKELQP